MYDHHHDDLVGTDSRTGRHPVNIGHLVMGVAFLGLVAVWALVTADAVRGDDIRWLLPLPWVLAGVAGLVGLITADRRRTGSQHTGWAGSDPTSTATSTSTSTSTDTMAE